MSNLTDEPVSTSGVYFEWEKEYVSFFYPKLDLSKLYFLKVVCNGELLDNEEVAPSEPKGPSFSKDTRGGGTTKEIGGPKAPHPEDAFTKEVFMGGSLMI